MTNNVNDSILSYLNGIDKTLYNNTIRELIEIVPNNYIKTKISNHRGESIDLIELTHKWDDISIKDKDKSLTEEDYINFIREELNKIAARQGLYVNDEQYLNYVKNLDLSIIYDILGLYDTTIYEKVNKTIKDIINVKGDEWGLASVITDKYLCKDDGQYYYNMNRFSNNNIINRDEDTMEDFHQYMEQNILEIIKKYNDKNNYEYKKIGFDKSGFGLTGDNLEYFLTGIVLNLDYQMISVFDDWSTANRYDRLTDINYDSSVCGDLINLYVDLSLMFGENKLGQKGYYGSLDSVITETNEIFKSIEEVVEKYK